MINICRERESSGLFASSILAIVNSYEFPRIPYGISLFAIALGYVTTYRSSDKDMRVLRTRDRIILGSVLEGGVVLDGQIVCIYT